MECNSRISKFCTGIGHPQWNGCCCNCEDEREKPSRIQAYTQRKMENDAEFRRLQELAEQTRHPNG